MLLNGVFVSKLRLSTRVYDPGICKHIPFSADRVYEKFQVVFVIYWEIASFYIKFEKYNVMIDFFLIIYSILLNENANI